MGCSVDVPTGPPDDTAGKASAALIGGTAGTHPEAGFLTVERGVSGVIQPSAVLLTPTLAVTTSFSVVKGYSYGVGVSFNSSGAVCATLGATVDPSQITFTLGDNASTPASFLVGTRGTSRAVRQIITNGEIDSCKGPLAFLVLDQPIEGVTFPQVELAQAPAANDGVLACGWGLLDKRCGKAPSLQCANGSVIIGGPNGGYYAADQDNFPPGFILTTVNACGDSGAPIYNASGALVALIDKYVNPDKSKVPTLANPCADCEGAVTDAHLLSAFPELVARAYAAVGSSPHRVGRPAPASVGGTCADNLDCNSQLCVGVGPSSYCSQDCSSSACPASTVCTEASGKKVCLPEVNPDPASCTTAIATATPGSSSTWIWGAGLALALAAGRRMRRSFRNARSR